MYSPDQDLAFRKENKEEEKKFPSHPFLNEESLAKKVLLAIDLDDTLIIDEHGNYILNKEIAEVITWLGYPFAIVTMRDPQESAMFAMIPQREQKTIEFCLQELKKYNLSPEKIITCYDPLEENFYQNYLQRIETLAINLGAKSESKDKHEAEIAEKQINDFLSKQIAFCKKIEDEYYEKNKPFAIDKEKKYKDYYVEHKRSYKVYKDEANSVKQIQLQYLAKMFPDFIIVLLDDNPKTFSGLMELKQNPPKNMGFIKNLFPVHFNRKDPSYLWLSDFINYGDPKKTCDIEKLPNSLKQVLETSATILATKCFFKQINLEESRRYCRNLPIYYRATFLEKLFNLNKENTEATDHLSDEFIKKIQITILEDIIDDICIKNYPIDVKKGDSNKSKKDETSTIETKGKTTPPETWTYPANAQEVALFNSDWKNKGNLPREAANNLFGSFNYKTLISTTWFINKTWRQFTQEYLDNHPERKFEEGRPVPDNLSASFYPIFYETFYKETTTQEKTFPAHMILDFGGDLLLSPSKYSKNILTKNSVFDMVTIIRQAEKDYSGALRDYIRTGEDSISGLFFKTLTPNAKEFHARLRFNIKSLKTHPLIKLFFMGYCFQGALNENFLTIFFALASRKIKMIAPDPAFRFKVNTAGNLLFQGYNEFHQFFSEDYILQIIYPNNSEEFEQQLNNWKHNAQSSYALFILYPEKEEWQAYLMKATGEIIEVAINRELLKELQTINPGNINSYDRKRLENLIMDHNIFEIIPINPYSDEPVMLHSTSAEASLSSLTSVLIRSVGAEFYFTKDASIELQKQIYQAVLVKNKSYTIQRAFKQAIKKQAIRLLKTLSSKNYSVLEKQFLPYFLLLIKPHRTLFLKQVLVQTKHTDDNSNLFEDFLESLINNTSQEKHPADYYILINIRSYHPNDIHLEKLLKEITVVNDYSDKDSFVLSWALCRGIHHLVQELYSKHAPIADYEKYYTLLSANFRKFFLKELKKVINKDSKLLPKTKQLISSTSTRVLKQLLDPLHEQRSLKMPKELVDKLTNIDRKKAEAADASKKYEADKNELISCINKHKLILDHLISKLEENLDNNNLDKYKNREKIEKIIKENSTKIETIGKNNKELEIIYLDLKEDQTTILNVLNDIENHLSNIPNKLQEIGKTVELSGSEDEEESDKGWKMSA